MVRPPNYPATVDRRPVKQTEYDRAAAVLATFNEIAGTAYTGKDWIAKVVLRLREHPDLTLDQHAQIIRAAFSDPWWRGAVSPSVVYGNGGIFERSIHAAANGTRTLTSGELDDLIAGRADTEAEAVEVE